MNASETPLPREPVNLSKQASDHEYRVRNLHQMIEHMEDYVLNEVPGANRNVILSMLVAAKELASRVHDEADELDVNSNLYGTYLMAIPVEFLTGERLLRLNPDKASDGVKAEGGEHAQAL